ncbi:hypothetical protein ACFLS1_01640 [Verrucomicrobiota bacterium]
MAEEVKTPNAGAQTGGLAPAGKPELKTVNQIKPKLTPSGAAPVKPLTAANGPGNAKAVLPKAAPAVGAKISPAKPQLVKAGGAVPAAVKKQVSAIKQPVGKKPVPAGMKKAAAAVARKKAMPSPAQEAANEENGAILTQIQAPPKPRCWWAAVLLFWTLLLTVASVGILYLSLLDKDVMSGIRTPINNIAAKVGGISLGPESQAKTIETVNQVTSAAEKSIKEAKESSADLKSLL